MLDTPDIRQQGEYDCSDAAIDCVLKLFGVRSCAGVLGMSSDADGMHPATIEALLRKAGLSICSGRMTIEDLRHHTRLGRAVLCPVDIFGGHWVVVRGAGIRHVHYHCPTQGRKQLLHDSWNAVWKDSTRAGHAFDQWGIATWASR